MKNKKIKNLPVAPELTEKESQSHERMEEDKFIFTAYPIYPANEDIYNKDKKIDIDPEDESLMKQRNEKPGKNNEKGFDEDETGADLDVPGSELDDEQEEIGSEDEENNYYSLGGDDHTDLEENKGE